MAKLQNKDKAPELSSNLFPVVGVGASAGGLEAFKRLLKAIPEDSGMAFILVQHLEPTHESILTDLLQKITEIPIHEITDKVRVEPDHIYIIPSNKLLTASDGILRLSPRPSKNEKNMPIDTFFKSLAEVHQSHAIGVVLSGTATDGTLGLKAIKDQGGVSFVQDPKSAAFNAMPQSAINADVVDFILTPEDIISQLIKLKQAGERLGMNEEAGLEQNNEDAFRQVLSLLRVRKGTDFTYYKQTTIRRRIIRRIGLNRLENITDYLLFLKKNKPEQDILYQDMLIPVTDFFRDPLTFDILCEKIFPQLLKNRDEKKSLRVWIAGCSTGEEAYSMAICLHEFLGTEISNLTIQIFATDISEKAIAKARSGLYNKKDITGLSAKRLEKYFTKVNGAFQINKFIRNMCIFACHNFLKYPPFAKIDIISCRNVLIYMESFLQKKALAAFHYSLKNEGYLVLGESESVSPAADLFKTVDNKHKIYQSRHGDGRFVFTTGDKNEKIIKGKFDVIKKEPNRNDFQKNADEVLLSKHTPPGVVVDEQLEIVQFRGSTGKWLEASPGKPTLNVIKMAREGMAFELRIALHKVKTSKKVVIKENIPIQFLGNLQLVTIEVIPLLNTLDHYYLILFKEAADPSDDGKDKKNSQGHASKAQLNAENLRIQNLENELAQVSEDMRNILEDHEASNEELQSSNEELLSGSEELQSLNEELETSREELQSTNEELLTLNEELTDFTEQLNISRHYAESIIATVREPFIILDKNLIVKNANQAYYEKFKTTEENTEGRLFYDLEDGQWNIPVLHTALEKILYNQTKITDLEIIHDFEVLGERILFLNAALVFRKENTEQLILLAIEDVTEKKRLEIALNKLVGELKDTNIALMYSNDNLQQFATIASHDLQEPLRKLRTFANLLSTRHEDEIKGEARELLIKINRSAERMAMLIKDVLNFSRISDSQHNYEKTDLNEILELVIDDFDLLIAEKAATIHFDRLPVIEAVPLQMNQLFYNLLGNALKFSKADIPPVINISSTLLSKDAVKKHPELGNSYSYCQLIFEDNGIGFDAQFSEQIFLIFQRLNSQDRFKGTGIGLALCKNIVVSHHGKIFADSVEGQGTRFHVILPVTNNKNPVKNVL